MNGVIAHVIGGKQPCSHLPLQTQVPLVDIHLLEIPIEVFGVIVFEETRGGRRHTNAVVNGGMREHVRQNEILSRGEALNRADVTVYPVSLIEDPNQPPFVHQALERIAADTNGEYFRYNTSFTPALRQIDKLSNGYYLLSYYTKPKSGAGFQKVQVALRNPEFKVRARQGYSYGD